MNTHMTPQVGKQALAFVTTSSEQVSAADLSSLDFDHWASAVRQQMLDCLQKNAASTGKAIAPHDSKRSRLGKATEATDH